MFLLLLLSLYHWSQWHANASPLPNSGYDSETTEIYLRDSLLLASETVQCTCPNLRSTFDIVWSSLLTIFICVWSSVHPNMIPPRMTSVYSTLHRRPGYMLLSLIMPEVTILLAARQFFGARVLRKRYEASGWTMTHGFFLQMGGFLLLDEHGQAVDILYADTLEHLLVEDRIELPKVTAGDIEDRSKRDGLAKGLAILQTTWFIVQCIARRAQHLPITQIELATVAFASLNGVMLSLWWYKPFDVKLPIPVQMRRSSQSSSSLKPSASQKSSESSSEVLTSLVNNPKSSIETISPHHTCDDVKGEVAETAVLGSVTNASANMSMTLDVIPSPVGDPGVPCIVSTPPYSKDQDPDPKVSHSLPIDNVPCSVSEPITAKIVVSNTDQIKHCADEVDAPKTRQDPLTPDNGASGNEMASLALARPLQDTDIPLEQEMQARVAHQSFESPPRSKPANDSTKKRNEDIQTELSKPIKVEDTKDGEPDSITPEFVSTHPVEQPAAISANDTLKPGLFVITPVIPLFEGREEEDCLVFFSLYAMKPTGSEQKWSALITLFFAVAFGAIHVVGWNLSFPSRTEKILWHIASVAHIVIPITMSAYLLDLGFGSYDTEAYMRGFLGRGRQSDEVPMRIEKRELVAVIIIAIVPITMTVLYGYARVYLLVEIIISLRALPPAAFEQVNWTQYIPHVSS